MRWTISALCLATLSLGGCAGEPPAAPTIRPVYAMRVADPTGLSERTFPGRARAAQEVNRSFRVPGPLIAFPVSVGDNVKQGDLLARIDPSDYETALRTVEGQLDRELARRTRTQQDLTRLQNTQRSDPGAISQSAIDQAQEALDAAIAGVRSLEASVQSARDQLSYTRLTAPFAGVVVETYVENFETVLPKQPIVRILDPTSIEFVISVPENLISYAPSVETIEVTFDALPGVKVPATVKEIGKEASQATRTYPVTLAMDQAGDREILPGMAGSARITARTPEERAGTGLDIPATAVFTGDDLAKSYVWVIEEAGNTLSRREVEIGELSRFGTLVKSGLEPGEWIVTRGVNSVQEGDEVRIIDDGGGVAS